MQLFILALGLGATLIVLAWGGSNSSPTLTALVAVFGLMTLKPSILGEALGPVGAIALLAIVLLSCRNELTSDLLPPGRQVLALVLLLAMTTLLAASSRIPISSLSGVVVSPIVAAAAWVVAAERRRIARFTEIAALFAAFQALALLVGQAVNASTIEFTQAGRDGWVYTINSLGAVTTGSGGILIILNQRLTGAFGESGLFAAFLAITACVAMANERRWRISVQVPLVVAILLTQSIAGFATYALGALVFAALQIRERPDQRLRARHHIGVSVGILASTYLAAQEDGLLAIKSSANAVAVADRTSGTAPAELLAAWVNFPFGEAGINANQGINLLTSSIAHGPAILILGLWLYLAPLLGREARSAAPIVAATLTTVLFAQPPLLYLWIFFAFVAARIAVNPIGDSPSAPDVTHAVRHSYQARSGAQRRFPR